MVDLHIHAINKNEKPQFVTLMYGAFKHDPLFIQAFGQANQQEKTAKKFLSALFDMNVMLGNQPLGIYKANNLMGCMLLEKPIGNKFENFYRMMAAIIKFIPTMLSMKGSTAKFLNDYMKKTRDAAPNHNHHYLAMIGILSTAQGQGLGRKLMQHAIQQCNQDPNSSGIALDTENETNIAIYKKWNFALKQQVDVSNIVAYCMFRSK
ncbi:MAG: GNAT family N-acetyltransferase [OCS116 cluster bacterium]|nr:GNAT family N-acetyltransferase [OCS116 cluster bacterium]